MNFDIAIIGFGVIGTESLYKITSGLNLKKKNKNCNHRKRYKPYTWWSCIQ